MNNPLVSNTLPSNSDILMEHINNFKIQIENKTFINNNECVMINKCAEIYTEFIYSDSKSEIIAYNKFIDYLKEVNRKTSTTSMDLHSYIVHRVSKQDSDLYKDESGEYHILTRPALERQSNYNESIRSTELCSLLLQIRANLRSEFSYREFYLHYLIKEYADIKHQIIKLELTRYKMDITPKLSTTMVILLDVLQLRYFELTNEISWMLNSIRNLKYTQSSLFYERYMFNTNMPLMLHNLKYYPSKSKYELIK